MAKASPRIRYADLLLGRSVLDFIEERRANGDSYRKVAADLRDATTGEIDVSDVTIRAWSMQAAADEPASADGAA